MNAGRLCILILLLFGHSAFSQRPDGTAYRTGTHRRLMRQFYKSRDGLPANSVSALIHPHRHYSD